MKRRDFLKAAIAVPVAAAFPASANPDGITADALRAIAATLRANVAEPYFAHIHPSVWFDIRRLRAISLWRYEYKNWRVARREGNAIETFEELMARVKASAEAPEVDGMRYHLDDAMRHGYIGSYESVRFIVSETT